jgi:hypothetical protein
MSPAAARDVRHLSSNDQLSIRRALTLLQHHGTESPHAQRVIQTGRPGLFSIRASERLRLFTSRLDERTVAVLAVARRDDFNRIVAAARQAATMEFPLAELQAAATILHESANSPNEGIHNRLKEVAPQVVSFAEASLKGSINWNAVGVIGQWAAVIISLITLWVALSGREPVQNFYINVEQVIELE